jgi:RNA polymerase sigma-70 factor (ECF subfamily)
LTVSEPLPPQPTPNDRGTIAATQDLLQLAKLGDESAREALVARYLPRLTKWASGRLPYSARSLLETNDLVQEALVRTLVGLERVEARGPGSFQSYVRNAILNRIRDQMRWTALRRGTDEPSEDLHDHSPSPLENAIGAETLARYERALSSLSDSERELLHLRVELEFAYDDIAAFTGRPTPDAARMAVQRALQRLAKAMGHGS